MLPPFRLFWSLIALKLRNSVLVSCWNVFTASLLPTELSQGRKKFLFLNSLGRNLKTYYEMVKIQDFTSWSHIPHGEPSPHRSHLQPRYFPATRPVLQLYPREAFRGKSGESMNSLRGEGHFCTPGSKAESQEFCSDDALCAQPQG